MRINRAICLAVALLGGPTTTLLAQGPDSANLAQLRPNRLVRIESPAMGRIQGTVVSQTAGELLLVNGGQHVIPLQSIQRVWVRSRHTKTGAIIGGVLGAGGGLFLGLVIQALCEDGCSSNPVVPVTLFGAAVGTGTGAIIGSVFPRWKELD